MPFNLDDWLASEEAGKWGALPRHTHLLKALFEQGMSPKAAAELFREDITGRPNQSDAAWRLWNLIFHAAASIPEDIDKIVQLILATRKLSTGSSNGKPLTSNIWPDWRDAYSFYQTWKTLDSAKSGLSPDDLTGEQRWINFTSFSAKLVQQGDDKTTKEVGVYGFFDVRNALEMTLEGHAKTLIRTSVITNEQSLSDDIEAAAQWVVFAGKTLHDTTNEFFGEYWTKGFAAETELWNGQAGFSPERWKFWSEQFSLRAEETWMSDSAKKAAEEASAAIRTFS